MGLPGRRCQVCVSKDRAKIEVGLVNRVPMAALAQQFKVHAEAIKRHRKNHLTPTAVAAMLTASRPSAIDLAALEKRESEGLLCDVSNQKMRLLHASDRAMEFGDIRAVGTIERALTANMELSSKLLGLLVSRHEVRATNLLIAPEYLRLRHTAIAALKPYPEAARALAAALHLLEQEAAADIERKALPAPAVSA